MADLPLHDLVQLFQSRAQGYDRFVAAEKLEARLIKRWLDHGLPLGQARARAQGNVMKNADYVTRNARAADISFQN